MALLLVLSVPVLAQEEDTAADASEELSEPGILPNSGLYGLKRAGERLGNLFYFRAEAKARRKLELAERRLAEANAMAEQDLDEYVDELSDEYEENLEEANEIAKLSKEEKLRERLAKMLSKATAKHLKFLEKAERKVEKFSEKAKRVIERARGKAVKSNMMALRVWARENPEEAAKLTMGIAEDLAEEAEQVAETDEEAGDVVEEYEEYANFGKEISEIAEQVGKDPMKVIELVRAARSRHLLVLQRVREKVPEQARVSIQKAIERSEEKIENGVKRLEEIKLRVREEKSGTESGQKGNGQSDITVTTTGDIVVKTE